MRIWQHDALVNVVYHKTILVFSRKSVLHMMVGYVQVMFSILTSNMVDHDISICSTTQPAFISSSASCAGVAAAAGEVAKDEKH